VQARGSSENNNNSDDETLVVLQTGGGTVTGYGLAAAQLMRLKNAGLKLTVAVEQVAASGTFGDVLTFSLWQEILCVCTIFGR
jgi:hypothetical protein